MGAMLTVSPEDMFTLQFAAFNNTQLGTFTQSNPNYGSEPLYFMARLTKSFTLGDLGLDVGAHARIGNVRLNTNSVIESDSPTSVGVVVDTTTYKVGDGLGRNWFGFEAQLYYDLLGGMKIMGEYLMGQDVNQLSSSSAPSPARVRDFTGWYIMLVKNLGEEFQFAVKYDTYAPNSTLDYDKINTSSELTSGTLGVGLHNYSFDKVRLTLWYDVNTTKTNEFTSGSTKPFSTDPIDNLLTFRVQYKF